jgi:hypothetical protein
VKRLLAVVIAGMSVAGCGMSSITTGLGGGMFGGKPKENEVGAVNKEELLSAARADYRGGMQTASINVAHGCPRFMVWTRDNHITIFEEGRIGDALAVMHRGEITKTARECTIQPGQVTVKYGFSGRVLLGPRGQSGRVTLPIQVFVADGKQERIAADKMMVDVDVSLDKPIGYFSKVHTVTFNIPEGTRPGEYEVFVGFERTAPGAG